MKLRETEFKTLKLSERQDLLNELKNLVATGKTDIDCQEVTESKFYNEMQATTFLDAQNIVLFNPHPKLMVLIAKIAAISPMLKAIDLSFNQIEFNSPIKLAEELAASSSIEEINIGSNHLGVYGPAIVESLQKLCTLKILNLSRACLDEYGPATAEQLIKLPALKEVDLSSNQLNGDFLATIKPLVDSHTLLKVDICENNGRMNTGGHTIYAGGYNLLIRQAREVLEDHNKKVSMNVENMISFVHATNLSKDVDPQFSLPKEIVCEIAGCLQYNHIDYILTCG